MSFSASKYLAATVAEPIVHLRYEPSARGRLVIPYQASEPTAGPRV